MHLDLTDEEAAALARQLHAIVEDDRYPLSPRIRRLKAILAKLRPEPIREPLSPPKVVLAVGRRSLSPILAAHDRNAAVNNQRLFVRDPGIDPYRDDGSGERANTFLEIARSVAISD